LDETGLAYASTVHETHGSDYPVVVIPVTTQHWPMLKRNLLYIEMLRGKLMVILVGQPTAVAMAVRGGGGERRRWSMLKGWLGALPAA
jgi:exodeoxyribonuclease V alpha subunit